MYNSNLVLMPCHQALLCVSFCLIVVSLPCMPDCFILMGESAIDAEHQVPARGHCFEIVLQCRMRPGIGRVPGVKETQDCCSGRTIYSIQDSMVAFLAGDKALSASIRLALGVNPQQIAGIVPQKVRIDADGSFHWSRKIKLPGLRLFATRLFQQGDHLY